MRVLISFISFWGMLLMFGCQSFSTATQPSLNVGPSETAQSVSPTQGEAEMTPALHTPADPRLQNLIETAKADLAQRLSISVDDIVVLQAESVTWPDASLGCPQEGMAYAQVLTPGYLIRLTAGDQEFEYHAGTGTTVVYCENPMPPVEGTPGDV